MRDYLHDLAKTSFQLKQFARNCGNTKKEFIKSKMAKDADTIPIWEEQIRHLKKISEFHIDTKKLTYANSHGDYHI